MNQVSVANFEAHTQGIRIGQDVYPVYDQGRGEVVLLLHGFPDSKYLWRYQIPALVEAGYRVIAPDLKGLGEAPKPPEVEKYQLMIVKDDILAIMDTMKIEQFYLVGHDWGAAIAWIIASFHPDKVKKLIALSVGAPGNSGTRTFEQLKASWYGLLIAQSKGIEKLFRDNDYEFLKKLTEGHGDLDRYLEDLSQPGTLEAALNYYRANFKPNFTSSFQLPKVQCDVMGVWSDGDIYLMEPHVKNSFELVEGKWRYEKIEGASHWMMLEKPDEVNRLILDFIQSQ